jgi:hypothetical protein
MEKAEFRMKLTKSDFSKAAWARLKILFPVRTYVIVVSFLLVGGILWMNIALNLGFKSMADVDGLIFLIFLALVLPLVGFQGMVHHGFKRGAARIEEYVYSMDKEGFGWKSDSMSVRLSWNRVKRIDETADFILVRVVDGPYFTIFKKRLPPDSLATIRKLIIDAPVKKKRLLNT